MWEILCFESLIFLGIFCGFVVVVLDLSLSLSLSLSCDGAQWQLTTTLTVNCPDLSCVRLKFGDKLSNHLGLACKSITNIIAYFIGDFLGTSIW